MRHLFLLLLLPLLFACKPGAPRDVLSAGRMEDVLYDYHLAQGLAQQAPSDSVAFYTRLYQEAVLRKYDLTAADFDRSMQWYARHTEKLNEIYKHLAERLGEAPVDGGAKDLAAGARSASGDSINIWNGPSAVVLRSKALNRYVYRQSVKVDTLFRENDLLQWKMEVGWHYNEGQRQAVAVLFVHYEGDSIATMRQTIYSSGSQIVSMRIAPRKVLSVEALVYQITPWSERPRLMSVGRFRLLRIRPKSTQAGKSAVDVSAAKDERLNPDSVRLREVKMQKLLRDSLLRKDTLEKRRSHFL